MCERFGTFFLVRSVIYDRRDNRTMIAILDSTKNRDGIIFWEEEGFEQPPLLLKTCYELTELMHL